MPDLTRRQFLALAGGAAGAAAAGTLLWSQLIDDQVAEQSARRSSSGPGRDRILVVVELAGGNDGLNTLVPAVGRYRDERPTLGVPEADLLEIQGVTDYSFHPSLAPLVPVWEAGNLAAVLGVGFEEQSLSHFQSTDVWRAAGGVLGGTSWLGRWLDATVGDQQEPLRAIALGIDTGILTSDHTYSTVIKSPGVFRMITPPGPADDAAAVVAAFEATASPLSPDPWMRDVQASIPATLEAVDVLAAAQVAGDQPVNLSPTYTDRFTANMEAAAQLVGLDLGTRILVVGLDGFDTHASQTVRQEVLLADVAKGIKTFLRAMRAQGRLDDVLLITTTEFGRRVAENGSAGSDHGGGGLGLLAGGGVKGQITGDLGIDRQVEGNLPISIDPRSLYAVGLDWLGGADTDEILNGSFDRYELV